MSNTLINDLNKKGYTIIKLPQIIDNLKSLEFDLKSLFINLLNVKFDKNLDQNTSLPKLINELVKNDIKSYFNVLKSSEHLISFYKIYTNDHILGVVKKIFGHEQAIMPVIPKFHIMGSDLNNVINSKGGYSSTPIHQDWFPLQASINTLTMWLPLTNDGCENFPLEIVEGSHEIGPIKTSDHVFGHQILEKNLSSKFKNFKKIFLKQGEIIIFNMYLVHKTSDHYENNHPRIACGLRFSDINENNYITKGYYRPFKITPDYLDFNSNENNQIKEKLTKLNLF